MNKYNVDEKTEYKNQKINCNSYISDSASDVSTMKPTNYDDLDKAKCKCGVHSSRLKEI